MFAVLLICFCFTGCGKEEIPQLLIDNAKPAVALAMYDPAKVTNEVEAEMVENVNTEYPFSVPANYRHIQDYVFAELNDSSEIIGFKIAIQQEDKSWKWEDCDSEGKIIEETTETSTTKETTTKSSNNNNSDNSNNTTTKKNNSSSSQTTKKTTTKETTTKKSSSGSSSSKPNTTSSPPKEQKFTWKTISQSSCPISVSNKFDKYILKKDAATVSASSNGSTYALIKAPAGQGVRVNSVSESGRITYSYTSSGSNYVIVSINRTVSVSYSKN